MEHPQSLLILLPLAVAAGIDLYLTLALLGLALWHAPPTTAIVPVHSAEGGLVMAGCAFLFLCEAVAQFRPLSALVWHNLQLLIRPLAGGLIGLLLFRGEGPMVLLTVASLGSVVAAFSHVMSWGQGLLLRLPTGLGSGPSRIIPFELAEDSAVLLLLALIRWNPDTAFGAALLFLILGLCFGHHLHGAARFGFVLLRGWFWGIMSLSEWANRDELPPWVLDAVSVGPFEGVRGVRAGRRDLSRKLHFEEGWLVERNHELMFANRRHRRSVIHPLHGARWRPGPGSTIARIHLLQLQEGTSTALFLQKDAPAPETHK